MLDDETLRDGLQTPSVTDPGLETKVELLHLMDAGIETANVGLPGAGPRQVEAVTRLCARSATRSFESAQLCGQHPDGRHSAHRRTTQRTGIQIEACVFIGTVRSALCRGVGFDHILRSRRKR